MMMGASNSKNKRSPLPEVDVKYVEGNYPPLKPPKTKKDIVFNPQRYFDVDEKAELTPRQYATAYPRLIKYLTEGLPSDIQRARSIYVWLSSQHIMEENYDDVTDSNTPLGYMKLIQEERGTYEQFFALLCRAAKLPCIIVQGNVKSVTYEVGDMDIECEYGYWNLVYLDGCWRIINPKWAMVSIGNYSNERWDMIEKDGKSTKRFESQGSLMYVYNRDDFYFLTDPEEHIYRCLPCNKKHQLLEEPWTMEKFLQVPFIENDFFKSGLRLPKDIKGVLKATEGEVEINLEVAKSTENLKYELYNEHKKRRLSGRRSLARYVFVNNERSSRTFFVRFQSEGTYRLAILTETEMPLCDFRIDCTGVKSSCEPFPINPGIGWGYGEEARKAGLTNPSQETGIVTIDNKKKVNFTFDMNKDLQVDANLIHSDMSQSELKKHVSHEKKGKQLKVTVDVPGGSNRKEYAVEINAKEKEDKKYRNVANYLLTTESRQPKKATANGTSPKEGLQSGSSQNANQSGNESNDAQGKKKGLFGRPILKNTKSGQSITEVNDETVDKGGGGSQTTNGTVSLRHVTVSNKDNKSDPPQTSKLAKNKTYSFKLKPDGSRQSTSESGTVESEKTGSKDLKQSSPTNESSRRRPSGSSLNAGSPASRMSGHRQDGNETDTQAQIDYSLNARMKRMKDAYLTDNPVKQTTPSKSPTGKASPDKTNDNASHILKTNPTTTHENIASPKGLNQQTDPSKSSNENKDPRDSTILSKSLKEKIASSENQRSTEPSKNMTVKAELHPTAGGGGPPGMSRTMMRTSLTDSSSRLSAANEPCPIGRPNETTTNMSDKLISGNTTFRNMGPGGKEAPVQQSGVTKTTSRNSTTTWKPPSRNSNIAGKSPSVRIETPASLQSSKLNFSSKRTTPDTIGSLNARRASTSKSPIPTRKSPGGVDNLVHDLEKAIQSRQLDEINKALDKTRGHAISPHPQLVELKAKAENIGKVMKRLNRYLHEVMAVNQATIAEIHSYNHPKVVVHDVMRATFLLLGERGSNLRKWHYVQQLMRRSSRDGLVSRIQEFDMASISIELAEYVKSILEMYDQDEVRLTSAGAGAFYNWCCNIVAEVQQKAAKSPVSAKSPISAKSPAPGKSLAC